MKQETTNYENLPDTITPEDYAKWRKCGMNKAREKFNAKGFPKLKGMGNKQLADKTAVYLYDLGLEEKELHTILEKFAEELIRKQYEEK